MVKYYPRRKLQKLSILHLCSIRWAYFTFKICISFVYRFYPYILMFSAVLMLITIFVYTKFDKLLKSHYNRLMRQYSFSMMMSFIFLAINQLESFKDHHGLCYFFGTYILLLINIISFLRIVSYIIILFRLYYTILYYCIIYIYDYNEL